MQFSNISIRNYKALREVSVPLSSFVCLTGENNAGKSSVLQALTLFLSPVKLDSNHFFDPSTEITITVTFSQVSESDMMRLDEEPRNRIRELLKDGNLELTRRFDPGGEITLGYYTLLPKEQNYSKEVVDGALKGKRSKTDIRNAIASLFPSKSEEIPSEIGSQQAAKELIALWGDALPADQKELKLKPIPTGAGFSIEPLLPEDIYVPAVKDLRDDVSVKQGSSFGKVLGILMGRIESQLADDQAMFERLRAKLTRVHTGEATEDKRLKEIIEIEKTIQKYVRESFANIELELEIPPPELRSLLSTARIFVNDGTKGPLDFKGDGLRRAVLFAILRTYVEEVAKKKSAEDETEEGASVKPSPRGYILLFEEPELFLHPDAQRILFDALGVFAKDHHVVVTTHSPLFLGPGAATFVRMFKDKRAEIPKPFTVATPVSLKDLDPKDEFQLICFENNNAALFARKVVLVEGDSEMIAFPHIASTLHSEWSCSKHSVAFVQAKGKSSIKRYRSFFKRFALPTFVIADLDTILRDFDKLDPTADEKDIRGKLIALIDKQLPKVITDPSSKEIKDAQGKGALKGLWQKVREAKIRYDADASKFSEMNELIQQFFDWEKKEDRLEVLQKTTDQETRAVLDSLLNSLRGKGIFILCKGEIEDYYPAGINGGDKPSKAQNFRNTVLTREQILQQCPMFTVGNGATKAELELICEKIFS